MNKRFSGRTVIKRDRGVIGEWASNLFGHGEGLEKVSLEDPQFQREFDVLSSDQVEARYLLTPAFMDRLLRLQALFKGARLQASFYDDRLFMMIESSLDRFEPGSIFTPVDFSEEINTVLGEMRELLAIIEILKLNLRTGV